MGFRRVAKVDSNQKQIVEALRRVGAMVIHTHQLKNAFDILVVYRGVTTMMEIKDGDKLPQKFFKMSKPEKDEYLIGLLTDGELKCMNEVIMNGGRYIVTYDIQSSIDALTLHERH